jgi:hypothetical protein
MKRQTIRSFLHKLNAEEYDNIFNSHDIRAYWKDFPCDDEELRIRTCGQGEKLKEIIVADRGKNIQVDQQYVIFTHCCPEKGMEYDEISIHDISTGRLLFTVIPKGRKGRAELWTIENKFSMAVVTGTWENVLRVFRNTYLIEFKRTVY